MDCLEGMKQLPDKCVDLVLTDFPYGIEEDYGDFYEDSKDNLKKLIADAMPQILRISKRAAVTCGIGNMFLYPPPTWVLSWFCAAGTGCGPWFFCCWQPILVYGKDPYLETASGRLPDAKSFNGTSPKNGHPCPKPLELWKWLLLRCSQKEGEIILDPFMGSGTTARACKDLGRNFIGFEINTKYCEIANKRLQQEVLF